MVKHMTKERAQQHLDNIIDWFDFEKVNEVMKALDWSWVGEGIPEPYRLKGQIRELFWDCFKSEKQDLVTISCGGFWVSLDKEQDFADCKFVVSDWQSSSEDFENE